MLPSNRMREGAAALPVDGETEGREVTEVTQEEDRGLALPLPSVRESQPTLSFFPGRLGVTQCFSEPLSVGPGS